MGYIVTALILLDLSSAFGIIERIILVDSFLCGVVYSVQH